MWPYLFVGICVTSGIIYSFDKEARKGHQYKPVDPTRPEFDRTMSRYHYEILCNLISKFNQIIAVYNLK
jgi:hypothetical protein